MKRSIPATLALGLSLLLAVSCSSVPDENSTCNGRPVITRASHPAAATTPHGRAVTGTYLGRRYFTPPGSKSGLQWIEVYGQ